MHLKCLTYITHMQKKEMNILLTGANGYIGQRLLPLLVAQGHDVVCADAINLVNSMKIEVVCRPNELAESWESEH